MNIALNGIWFIFLLLQCLLCMNAFKFGPTTWTNKHHGTRTMLRISEVTVNNLDNNQSIKIPPGSPLSLAAVRSGMRLSFQCKQGVCSSCETLLNGTKVRTCVTKVPDVAKITIKKAPR